MLTQHRVVDDTRIAIAATLTRPDGTAVNLTGLTVKFHLIAADGTDKVALTETNVTVTDAAAGEVQYDPQAADVDTAGKFYAYFVITTGGNDTFPVHVKSFIIIFADK